MTARRRCCAGVGANEYTGRGGTHDGGKEHHQDGRGGDDGAVGGTCERGVEEEEGEDDEEGEEDACGGSAGAGRRRRGLTEEERLGEERDDLGLGNVECHGQGAGSGGGEATPLRPLITVHHRLHQGPASHASSSPHVVPLPRPRRPRRRRRPRCLRRPLRPQGPPPGVRALQMPPQPLTRAVS